MFAIVTIGLSVPAEHHTDCHSATGRRCNTHNVDKHVYTVYLLYVYGFKQGTRVNRRINVMSSSCCLKGDYLLYVIYCRYRSSGFTPGSWMYSLRYPCELHNNLLTKLRSTANWLSNCLFSLNNILQFLSKSYSRWLLISHNWSKRIGSRSKKRNKKKTTASSSVLGYYSL